MSLLSLVSVFVLCLIVVGSWGGDGGGGGGFWVFFVFCFSFDLCFLPVAGKPGGITIRSVQAERGGGG